MIGRIMAVSGEEHPVASPLPGEYLLAKNVCSDDPSITLPWSVVVHEDGRAAAVYIDFPAEDYASIEDCLGDHGLGHCVLRCYAGGLYLVEEVAP